jgi:hypothetical protein
MIGSSRRVAVRAASIAARDARAAALSPSSPFLRQVQQESFGSGHPPFVSVFSDRDHLAEERIIRHFPASVARAASRVAAAAFLELCGLWRLAVADLFRGRSHFSPAWSNEAI